MRTWDRVAFAEHCGHCGVILLAGAWVQILKLGDLPKPKYRCVECADGKPPEAIDVDEWEDQHAYRDTP